MAYQVAGKAARDALFLSNFGARHLPAIVVTAALTAILLGVVSSRLLSKIGPGKLIPALMVGSAGLQALEWFGYRHFPGWTAVIVYVHIVSLGAVITSGFWSVINEQLDPYTAKRNFGRIAAAGTGGGVAGGFVAERLAVFMPAETVLLFLTVAQVATAAMLALLPPVEVNHTEKHVRARDLLRKSSYLRNISYLVALGTFSAALLDYVLKAQARHTIGPGEPLLRFFAMFHTGTALLSFLLQTTLTPAFLSRVGLGAGVASLPAGVTGGGIFAVLNGTLPFVVVARGLEAVIRGSLFRAGYELLYTPMIPAEKRALKSINDVTVDRLGDALGGGFAQLAISTVGSSAETVMMATGVAASAISLSLARWINKGYIKSLERSLRHRAMDLEASEPEEAVSTRASISGTETQTIMLGKPAEPVEAPAWMPPAVRQQWSDLMSADRERIKSALIKGPALDRAMLPTVIPLLRRKSVSDAAARSLRDVADRNVGQLSDFLLDSTTDVIVRCKLPEIIAEEGGQRAVQALIAGLDDIHLEVRFQCGRALDTLRQRHGVEYEADVLYEIIERELSKSPDLEHVFSLIGVVLPREPVRVAFEALGASDPQLRGLALEYLESALPSHISERLIQIVDRPLEPGPSRPVDLIRQEFLDLVHRARSEEPRSGSR
jgi:hypothetical protein